MSDQYKVKCKVCQEEKIRMVVGTYPNGKDVKYGNETGKLWSGRTCPDCNKARAKSTMQKTRAKV